MLAFYRPVERPLADAVDWDGLGVPLTGYQGTPWLIADLLDLGCTQAHVIAHPDCRALPEIITFWQAIGSWRARPWAGS